MTIFDSPSFRRRLEFNTIAIDAQEKTPKLRNLLTFTGSVTLPLITKIVVKLAAKPSILARSFSVEDSFMH